jgi:hypothetical protein
MVIRSAALSATVVFSRLKQARWALATSEAIDFSKSYVSSIGMLAAPLLQIMQVSPQKYQSTQIRHKIDPANLHSTTIIAKILHLRKWCTEHAKPMPSWLGLAPLYIIRKLL